MASADDLGDALKKCSLEEADDEYPDLTDDAKVLLESIQELECPFTWKPCKDMNHDLHTRRIEEKLEEITEGEEMVLPWHTFFMCVVACYEYAQKGSLDGALAKLRRMEAVLSEAQEVPTGGLRHVVSACKCFIMFKKKKYDEVKEILDTIVLFRDMDDRDQAGVWGTRAAVYQEYGYSGMSGSVEYIENALKLDDGQAEWHFLLGKVLGRIRRISKPRDVPDERELGSLEKAYELTGDVPYMLFLAQVLRESASRLHSSHKGDFMVKAKCVNMYERAATLYKEALTLRKDCSHVNLRCALGYLKMPSEYCDRKLVDSCIQKALYQAPSNPMVHHVAGYYYERKKDVEKARHHYKESADGGAFGSFMDLIKLNIKTIPNYNPIPDFERGLALFTEKPISLKVHVLIGSYWYFVKDDFKKAYEHWKIPLIEDPTLYEITAHRCLFVDMKISVDIHEIVFHEARLLGRTNSLSSEEIQQMLDMVSEYSKNHPNKSPISVRSKVLNQARCSYSRGRGRGRGHRGGHLQSSAPRAYR